MNYEPIIGIEIHVELATKSKMFCSCDAQHFGVAPNTHTCPVCLGLPGALPVANEKAVAWTYRIGKALHCQLNKNAKFDRKHYFYPDLPKAYQISQYDQPFCGEGYIDTDTGRVTIERVHLEEDTAKSQHKIIDGEHVSLIDFNRSSVPLVEIVTKPDVQNSQHAREYAKKIQQIVRFLAVSDGDLEKGSMRLEANISLRPKGQKTLPDYKVEVKNLNSFRFLKESIEYEMLRQAKILDSGNIPTQETRGWNESKNQTVSQRSKEEAQDYRYFPDPDLPPLRFSEADIADMTADMPLLPDEVHAKLEEAGVRESYRTLICADPALSTFVLGVLKASETIDQTADKIAGQIINTRKNLEGYDVKAFVSNLKKKLETPSASVDEMKTWVQQSIKDNPEAVKKYLEGKKQVLGAFMGSIMKASKGKADPKQVMQQLKQELESKS